MGEHLRTADGATVGVHVQPNMQLRVTGVHKDTDRRPETGAGAGRERQHRQAQADKNPAEPRGVPYRAYLPTAPQAIHRSTPLDVDNARIQHPDNPNSLGQIIPTRRLSNSDNQLPARYAAGYMDV
jgi:hypothetical protein